MILNLGCGSNWNSWKKNAVNVDIRLPANQIVDLSIFPWPWDDNSIDTIFASHILEHFQDQEKFLSECHRILKPGGILRLNLPHSSSVSSVGCMGHYRTYSYSAISDYLSREGFYLCKSKRFETICQRLNWWYERFDDQNEVPIWQAPIVKSMNYVLTRLANLSPKLCENLWCYWCGGFREVIWTGYKI
jgi:SAM-dependent methyltransferase